MVSNIAFARRILVGCSVAGLVAFAGNASAQTAPIVQPGAPGEAPRVLTSEQAVQIADTSFSAADVQFMQGMIHHHQQAVEMAALVKDRTNNPAILDVASRIDSSQADEMAFMRNWLQTRGQPIAGAHAMHGAHMMPGMATPQEMAALQRERAGVRSHVPGADDRPPRRRGGNGRNPARPAGFGL